MRSRRSHVLEPFVPEGAPASPSLVVSSGTAVCAPSYELTLRRPLDGFLRKTLRRHASQWIRHGEDRLYVRSVARPREFLAAVHPFGPQVNRATWLRKFDRQSFLGLEYDRCRAAEPSGIVHVALDGDWSGEKGRAIEFGVVPVRIDGWSPFGQVFEARPTPPQLAEIGRSPRVVAVRHVHDPGHG